jgi:DnaJ family protein C protein 7
MATRRFDPAQNDYQQAIALQSPPQPETLVSLTRCHLALGLITPAIDTIKTAISIDPQNVSAFRLEQDLCELEPQIRELESAIDNQQWQAASSILKECFRLIDNYKIKPTQWMIWRVELDLATKDWSAAKLSSW